VDEARSPSRLRWLPNAITIARLAALPAMLAVLIAAEGPTSTAGAVLFTVIGATDFVDGRLARILRAESRLGRVLDPLADRLLVAVGLVGLILLDRVHPAAPALILARDAVSIAGFVVFARRGVLLRVDFAGKCSSALAMFAVGFALLLDQTWVDVLVWAAVAVSLATFANYARTAARRWPRQPASTRA